MGVPAARQAVAEVPDLSEWDRLNEVPDGHKVTVVRGDATKVTGQVVAVTGDAITLQPQGAEEIEIPRDEVFQVLVREKVNRAKNALIGTSLGPAVVLAGGGGTNANLGELLVATILISTIGGVIGLFLPPEDIIVYEAEATRLTPSPPDPRPRRWPLRR